MKLFHSSGSTCACLVLASLTVDRQCAHVEPSGFKIYPACPSHYFQTIFFYFFLNVIGRCCKEKSKQKKRCVIKPCLIMTISLSLFSCPRFVATITVKTVTLFTSHTATAFLLYCLHLGIPIPKIKLIKLFACLNSKIVKKGNRFVFPSLLSGNTFRGRFRDNATRLRFLLAV